MELTSRPLGSVLSTGGLFGLRAGFGVVVVSSMLAGEEGLPVAEGEEDAPDRS